MKLTNIISSRIVDCARGALFIDEIRRTKALVKQITEKVEAHDKVKYAKLHGQLVGMFPNLEKDDPVTHSETIPCRHLSYGTDFKTHRYQELPENYGLHVRRPELLSNLERGDGSSFLNKKNFLNEAEELETIYKEANETFSAVLQIVGEATTLGGLLEKAPSLERVFDDELKRHINRQKEREIRQAEERRARAAERRKQKLIAEQMAEIKAEEGKKEKDAFSARIAKAVFKGDI